MRALVADADAGRRAALRGELERHGHDVAEVASAREALVAVERDAPLVVVLAWRLGRDEAPEVCRGLLTAAGPVSEPIVVVVGADEEVDPLAALDAGATDVWVVQADPPPGSLRVRLELAEHYARLQAEHVRIGGEFALLRKALDLTGTGFILTDPRLDDAPIVYANESFVQMTGYRREEILGRNCRFLQGPETDPQDIERMRVAIRGNRPITVELRNHRADGTAFWNEVHISPVRDERGEVVRFVGVQVDVSAYRDQRRLVALEQRARRAAEAAERRSAFLADASPELDASLDLRTTLDSLARISVPFLADACLVHVRDGDTVQRVASAAADDALDRLIRALPARHAVGDPADPLAQVVASGRSVVLRGGDAAAVLGPVAAGGAARGALLRHTPRAAMVVPLRARGRTIGVLSLVAVSASREIGPDELALAEDLARRAALALDNARLYEHQRAVAATLQESLVPERLPDLRGIELGARFRPAGDGAEIGGDFFDVVRLGEAAATVTVGDVAGKGARAAALTGLTRHTLRTAATYEQEPRAVLAALNRALLDQRGVRGKYCTVAMCRVERDATGADVRMACAGHPLPLVLRAGGEVVRVGRPGMLLGYVAEPDIAETRLRLAPGDALVLYTDGVTAATPTGDEGATRLATLLADVRGSDADAIAHRLEGAAVRDQGGDTSDDIAVAVVRIV